MNKVLYKCTALLFQRHSLSYNLHVSCNKMATKEHFSNLNLKRNLSHLGTNYKAPGKINVCAYFLFVFEQHNEIWSCRGNCCSGRSNSQCRKLPLCPFSEKLQTNELFCLPKQRDLLGMGGSCSSPSGQEFAKIIMRKQLRCRLARQPANVPLETKWPLRPIICIFKSL